MRLLINCSTLKVGGGVQVAHSFLSELKKTRNHNYIVVCCSEFYASVCNYDYPDNFIFYRHDHSFGEHILNRYLRSIVKKHEIDKVFTVFGPSYWNPKVRHVCGYAKAQYIYRDSPFFSLLSIRERAGLALKRVVQMYFFRRADILITENSDVSAKLRKMVKGKKVFTVTNYYNQLFETPDLWERIDLPDFNGTTLLTIASNYPHKNYRIIPLVVRVLKEKYPNFNFRFVLSLNPDQLPVDEETGRHILFLGPVSIEQCPSLYTQADIMFLPTLIECFSASYPEAMYMQVPIITSDLEFARGLCGDAACYVDPLSAEKLADAIYTLSKDDRKRKLLVEKGKEHLLTYDTYADRAKKYLSIIENETDHSGPQIGGDDIGRGARASG